MNELESTPFDQYQRYALASGIISELAGGKHVSVLELGAHVHANLNAFLPAADIVLLDKSLPPGAESPPNFVIGDACNLACTDNAFDFVVALDVLEHVESTGRARFLAESTRVARRGVILAFPYDDSNINAAEREVNDVWKRHFQSGYPWLEEHVRYGLPRADDVTRLAQNAAPFALAFDHGSLACWKPLMKLHFLKEAYPELSKAVNAFDRLYDERLFDSDFANPAYRQFLVLTKSEEDMRIVRAYIANFQTASQGDAAIQNALESWAEGSELLCDRLRILRSEAAQRDDSIASLNQAVAQSLDQIATLNQTLAERDAQIANLNHVVAERDAQIATLNQTLAERDAQIATLNQTLAERDAKIATLNQTLAERDAKIATLNQTLAERDAQITSLNQIIAARDAELLAIRRSTSWRLTRPVRFLGQQRLRFRFLKQAMPAILEFGGGPLGAIRKAWRILRREGIAGIRHRILVAGARDPVQVPASSPKRDYAEWVRQFDTLDQAARSAVRRRINALSNRPLISVVMPVFDPPTELLDAALRSVRNQLYPHWELCIADDASTNPEVRNLLERHAAEDQRIKIVFRKENGHISRASNSALELASGDFIALLDHDDVLSELALFWVADAIVRSPAAGLVYSDEDKIDLAGNRHDPYFKCEWNPELFLSHNMITHLGVYRTTLVREIGGFREGFEGAQDYDLALRCVERLTSEQIVHIPRVLYHWRRWPGSTALAGAEKPYAMLAGERALNEHLSRRGLAARAQLLKHCYRIHFRVPDPVPLVSLIIPTKNGLALVRKCVDSIFSRTRYPSYEIIIVDNGSDEPATLSYFQSLSGDPRVRVLPDPRPFNFSALNNAAVACARGSIVGLVNNDIEVISPDWLHEMVGLAVLPEVGAVGARLWYPNDTLQHGGVILGIGGYAGHSHKGMLRGSPGYWGRGEILQSLSAVTAACLIVRKELYEQVGGLDENNLAIACNDVDFCLRVREAGFRNVWTPYAELYHHESATRGYEDSAEKQARFAKELSYLRQRWGQELLVDPAYSPNLTLDREDFSLAWPPRVELLANASGVETMTRTDKVFFAIDKKGLGLEIGPSHRPLAPKKEGYQVKTMDHATREELMEKYQGHGVDTKQIEEVDYVWRGEPIDELVGEQTRFDYIIASHLIEHTPDLVSFLRQLSNTLKADGVISLVIPDKRYCFDYYRFPSSTGDVLQAYLEKRKTHSPGVVFDHFAHAAKMNGSISWAQQISGELSLVHSFQEAIDGFEQAKAPDKYIDVHHWRFTPASFRLILSDLRNMGLLDLVEEVEFGTAGCEFFVTMKRGTGAKETLRMPMLNDIVAEATKGYASH